MKKAVSQFVSARKNLFEYFGCKDDYPVKVFSDGEWAVRENGGMHFLTVRTDGGTRDYALAKKDGEPLVYKTRDYSMAIAIDCIKTAFVFKNSNY